MSEKEVEISGAYFSVESLRERYDPKELGKIWCILNCWKTPEQFELGRELSREEVMKVFKVVRKAVSHSDRMAEWKTRHEWMHAPKAESKPLGGEEV